MAHTGLSKRVVAAIAALRRKRASNADKVFETTYADADAGPTAIAHGWTLEELYELEASADENPQARLALARLSRDGIPRYDLSELEKAEELLSLSRYGPAEIVPGDGGQPEIGQAMHAQGFSWSYHPHSWEVRCGDMLTPIEVFRDNEKLWAAQGKRAKHGSVNSLTNSDVRKGLKAVTGAQDVSSTSVDAVQSPRQWQGAEFPRFFYEGGISNTAAC